MRLDWYLPVIRKPKDRSAPRRRSLLVRAARRLLPASFFSDPRTKQRGLLRQWLRRLGISWLASPIRRLIQGFCFVVFLILFLYVCWPYDAKPTRTWTGIIPAAVDPDSGVATVITDSPLPITADQLLFVSEGDPASPELSDSVFGRFTVRSVKNDEIILAPAGSLTDEEKERLLLSPGPWVLSERRPSDWPSHYADNLQRKEKVAAELFLVIDPLVSLSTGIASRAWVWSLTSAGVILLVCVLIPRGFCGYICPLGTLIDLFDSLIGRRVTRFRVSPDGWWVHLKYYLLLGIMVAAVGGVLLSGFFAAIPVITRGLLFTVAPLQNGLANGFHQVPPFHAGHLLSLAMFFGVLALGLLRPRFWCRYVCPSGAVFSLGNLFRVSERKVESSCIHCNKCVEVCPFDAIKADFTTRTTDCTLCQTCAGVCPTQAIKFVGRWEDECLKEVNVPPTGETVLGRRGFLSAAVGTAAGTAGGAATAAATSFFGAHPDSADSLLPIRPPGSVPEQQFLQMCIRCGECFKACPSDVLQPLGFQQGLEGLWTPHVVADWSGCSSGCNNCGQVCPTGAIRALPLEEKKVARMGLAVVNETTCLPFAGREECRLCVDECDLAGYNAIEFLQVGTETDAAGRPIEGTGFLAPVVLADRCVGCGLCQTRCRAVNVGAKGLLEQSAIIVEAGEGKEDRIMSGSYTELREQEQKAQQGSDSDSSDYLPDFLRQSDG